MTGTARNPDAVKALAREIKAGGGNAESAKVDALNEPEIDNLLKKVVPDNGKLDIVFNGIAVEYSEMGGRPPATEATFEQFMAKFPNLAGMTAASAAIEGLTRAMAIDTHSKHCLPDLKAS